MISRLPWDCWLILLALAVIVPWRGAARIRKLMARPSLSASERLVTYAATSAAQWIATAIIFWRATAHGWGLASLGLAAPNPLRDTAVGVGLSLILATTQFMSLRLLARTPEAQQGVTYEMLRKLMPQAGNEVPGFLGLVGTVSFCEEFLYRGFAFAAFLLLFTGSIAAAIVSSSILFGIGHIYQGRRGVILTFVLGMIFASLRAWTGSLLPCAIIHFVVDSIAGVMGPQLLKRAENAKAETPPSIIVI